MKTMLQIFIIAVFAVGVPYISDTFTAGWFAGLITIFILQLTEK